jgi:hypothetical protein
MGIDKWLRQLESLQDDITHFNEMGASYTSTAREKIAEREELHKLIVIYVGRLEAEVELLSRNLVEQ